MGFYNPVLYIRSSPVTQLDTRKTIIVPESTPTVLFFQNSYKKRCQWLELVLLLLLLLSSLSLSLKNINLNCCKINTALDHLFPH